MLVVSEFIGLEDRPESRPSMGSTPRAIRAPVNKNRAFPDRFIRESLMREGAGRRGRQAGGMAQGAERLRVNSG